MTAPLRTSSGAPYAQILGVGGYRPSRVVTNDEICQHIESSDLWIRTRSGIAERRWATPEETVLAMSVAAAGKAVAAAGIRPEQVGCVLISTVTHLTQTPAIATSVATNLGADGVAAFDISAACAGFCYGIEMAKGMVCGGSAEYVVVVGVERLSDIVDPSDRSTAFLFGDGAGAAVIGPADEPAIGPIVWGSEGTHATTINQTGTWETAVETGRFPYIQMEGNTVYRWASYDMAKVAQQALDRAGIGAEDLDAFIPHQANMRITDSMVKGLKLPDGVAVARDIEFQGNTSAASIPLAMERMLEAGEIKRGDTALIIGFGAGLVYGAQVVTIP